MSEVFDYLDREFVSGPPLMLHLPVCRRYSPPPGSVRESLLAGPTDRVVREVVAAAVSMVNECPYCVDSHTASTSALGVD